MQSRVSVLSFSIFLLSGFLWKHVFELFKWNEQFGDEPIPEPKRNTQEVIEVSQIESNCGISDACTLDSFPVYLSTGSVGESLPKLCISGKHLLPINGPEPKGLTAAVVEPTRFEIMSVRNFDSYRLNKTTDIVSWLKDLIDNDILIIFTSGEPSMKLAGEALRLLNDLGSGVVQNLRYRSQWYMITQKGTQGFAAFEKITYPKSKRWAGDLIEFKSCVPRKVPKHKTVADETLHENKLRTRFCNGKTDNKYKGFCQESRFELIIPSLLTNRSLIGNPAYSSPFFLYASDNFELLAASMDSLLHQPGVFVPLITILYEERQTDVPDVARMYGMQARKVSFGKTFLDKLNQARRISQKEHSEQPFIIVVDQNVILSPDFLFFMAQTIQTIKTDGTVVAISAWSPNCYSQEGDVHLSYRTEGSAKYAALVPVQPRNDIFGELIVPDVSRVQGPEACHLPSLEPDNWIARPQDLTKERYFHKLVMLQQLGHVVEAQTVISNCSETTFESPVNIIYYNYDDNNLSNIVHCLGVVGDEFGMYEGIVRLTVSQKTVLIITSESSFYRSRPIATQALTPQQPTTSTRIGLAYRSPYYFSYGKQQLGRIPNIEVTKPFAGDEIYSTTYNDTFIRPSVEKDNTNMLKKCRRGLQTEFPKLIKPFPTRLQETEYRNQYLEKPLPMTVKGSNIEKLSTCPIILTGRDERDPVPLTNNIAKYLDIYVSTMRQDYRRYSEAEQLGIATKDVVTAHETMEIPKGRGFGMKFPALPGQELDKLDKNMIDVEFSKKEFKLRRLHKPLPMIPPDMSSEYGSAYIEPTGFVKRHAFNSFVEYPEVNPRSTTQAICPPGMFSTEYDIINNHTTPQTVV